VRGAPGFHGRFAGVPKVYNHYNETDKYNYAFHTPIKCTYVINYMYYYQYSPTCFGTYGAICREKFFSMLKTIVIFCEDGEISAETGRRVLVIIHVFFYICAFCLCIKDIIYEEMHMMKIQTDKCNFDIPTSDPGR
jgi:hypothetical protein